MIGCRILNAVGKRINCKSTSLLIMALRPEPSTILIAAEEVRATVAIAPAVSIASVTVA